MAKLMKSFIGQIGGLAGRVTGSDTCDSEVDKESRIRESPVESKLSLSGSDDADALGGSSSNEEEDCYEQQVPSLKGCLNKWTNYLHGWQERYFVVGEGILSYYKSEVDIQFGCRGSITVHKAKILVSGWCVCVWRGVVTSLALLERVMVIIVECNLMHLSLR